MPENPVVVLPPKYYLDYFEFLLTFVQKLYGHILNPKEREFIDSFGQLSEDAKCLYVRFSNRSGLFFRTNKLKYSEIENIEKAIEELLSKGFVETLNGNHKSFETEILNLFTKEEWLSLAPPTMLSLKPLKKPDIVRFLSHEFDFEVLIANISTQEQVVKTNFEVEVMMFKFLFFGNRYGDMTDFVVRDLGKVNFEKYRDDAYTARFTTRQEADDKLMVSLISENFYELQQQAALPPEEIYDWFMNWNAGVKNLAEVAQQSYARLVNKIGFFLERQKLPEQALQVYQLSDLLSSRERRVRLLQKMNLTDEALALCRAIADNPQNADERFFAIDFEAKILNSKKKIVKSVTRFLNDSESVEISIDYKYNVEEGVAEYFRQQGKMAIHGENLPWRALFGLVFWEIIYDANVQAIHHPLQRMPSDFYLPDFYRKREHLLKNRLAELTTNESLTEAVESTFIEKFGTANVLVEWHEVMLEIVKTMVKYLTVKQIHLVLLEMALNLREHTRGFADLMVWDDDGLEIIEVKSPTDHLSAQQLYWLNFMQSHYINAKVLRVVWK